MKMELPDNLISLIFGPDCFLTSDYLILLIEKFILFFFLLILASSVLTVIVFLSPSIPFLSADALISVVIGLTALLFSLDPKSPNLFFLEVGETSF